MYVPNTTDEATGYLILNARLTHLATEAKEGRGDFLEFVRLLRARDDHPHRTAMTAFDAIIEAEVWA